MMAVEIKDSPRLEIVKRLVILEVAAFTDSPFMLYPRAWGYDEFVGYVSVPILKKWVYLPVALWQCNNERLNVKIRQGEPYEFDLVNLLYKQLRDSKFKIVIEHLEEEEYERLKHRWKVSYRL